MNRERFLAILTDLLHLRPNPIAILDAYISTLRDMAFKVSNLPLRNWLVDIADRLEGAKDRIREGREELIEIMKKYSRKREI